MVQPLQVLAGPAGASLLIRKRYIELNPVRAAMVMTPSHYRWINYRPSGLGAGQILHDTSSALSDGWGGTALKACGVSGLLRAQLDCKSSPTFVWRSWGEDADLRYAGAR